MSKHGANVRLFVDQPLQQGTGIALGGGQAQYVTRVMRLQSGDQLMLFNPRDGEWRARISAVGRGWCELLAEHAVRPARAEPGPHLAFAPLKKDPMQVLVEKATELGVGRLLPVVTRYTAVEQVNHTRMQAHAIEAAEQCGRLTIPDIGELEPLDAFLTAWPAGRPLLFLDERAQGWPIADVLTTGGWPEPPGILLGPEGGFAEAEAAGIRALASVVPVTLGPRILRAETAAIAALACWQAFAGDWRAANRSES